MISIPLDIIGIYANYYDIQKTDKGNKIILENAKLKNNVLKISFIFGIIVLGTLITFFPKLIYVFGIVLSFVVYSVATL